MSKVELTDDAKKDIRKNAKYYEGKQSGLGHDYLDEVGKALERIKQNPRQFPQIYREVRKALTGRFPHQILFIMKSVGVIVFSIFHSSQNPEKWKSRADEESKK